MAKFEFIHHNSATDSAVRTRIRSHAARGRNVGKRLTRPSRRKAPSTGTIFHAAARRREPRSTGSGEDSEATPAASTQVGPLPSGVGETLSLQLVPFACLPTPWRQDRSSAGLLYKAVSFLSRVRCIPGLDRALDYSGEHPFIQSMFADEAFFHGAMALAIAALNRLCTARQEPADRDAAVAHLCRSFRLLNPRLSGAGAASDDNMAAVIVLDTYERSRGRYREGRVHLAGLCRMVEMRGGLGAMAAGRPELPRKLFKADLEYALNLCMPTHFTTQEVASFLTTSGAITTHSLLLLLLLLPPESSNTNGPPTQATPPTDEPPLGLTLPTLLSQAAALSRRLHQAATDPSPSRPQLSSRAVGDAVLLLGYRLVRAARAAAAVMTPFVPPSQSPSQPADADADAEPVHDHDGGDDDAGLRAAVYYAGLAAFVSPFLQGSMAVSHDDDGPTTSSTSSSGGGMASGGRPLAALARSVVEGLTSTSSSSSTSWHRLCTRPSLRGTGGRSREGLEEEEEEMPLLLLWVVFTGVAAGLFEGAADESWLVPRTVEVLEALGLLGPGCDGKEGGWEAVASQLARFPWVEEVHGGKGRAYYGRVVAWRRGFKHG